MNNNNNYRDFHYPHTIPAAYEYINEGIKLFENLIPGNTEAEADIADDITMKLYEIRKLLKKYENLK